MNNSNNPNHSNHSNNNKDETFNSPFGSFDNIKDTRLRLPEFDGDKDDYDQWFDVCLARFSMYNLRETDKVKMMNAHLIGRARLYLANKEVQEFQTINELDKLLRPCFSDRVNWHSTWADLVMNPAERVQDFAIRIQVAASGCGFGPPGVDKQCTQMLKKRSIPAIQRALLSCRPRLTFDECVEHAVEFERSIQELEKSERKNPK
jgi:hypothetical protein